MLPFVVILEGLLQGFGNLQVRLTRLQGLFHHPIHLLPHGGRMKILCSMEAELGFSSRPGVEGVVGHSREDEAQHRENGGAKVHRLSAIVHHLTTVLPEEVHPQCLASVAVKDELQEAVLICDAPLDRILEVHLGHAVVEVLGLGLFLRHARPGQLWDGPDGGGLHRSALGDLEAREERPHRTGRLVLAHGCEAHGARGHVANGVHFPRTCVPILVNFDQFAPRIDLQPFVNQILEAQIVGVCTPSAGRQQHVATERPAPRVDAQRRILQSGARLCHNALEGRAHDDLHLVVLQRLLHSLLQRGVQHR
mmetsp:Transcript_31544/g.90462  ORF Transcript_31544/g.90462 Transcript_31544/m.90462 type:complete len:308 (-) Transcript_31544:963-1886(-)